MNTASYKDSVRYSVNYAIPPGRERRVLGPPGCGKTTELSRQIEAEVKRRGSESVLVMSLTRAAAAELVGRELPLDREQLGTLHSHAYRCLDSPRIANTRERYEEWNTFVEERGDKALKLTQGVSRDDFGVTDEQESVGDRLFAAMDALRARMVPRDEWPESVRDFHEEWSAWKQKNYLADFTDLIESCLGDVERAPGNPQCIFLDEAQDFSKLELALARKWARHADKLVLAGDPDQALYSWRGAEPRNFLEPDIAESSYHELEQSYRVPKAVHRVAVEWIRQVRERRDVRYLPTPHPGSVSFVNFHYGQPERVFSKVEGLIAQGKSVMFLATASYMLKPLLRFFRDEGVPFHNPYVDKRGDWNPLRSRKGAKSMAERIRAFLYGGWLGDPAELRAWLDLLKLDHFRADREVTKDYLRKLRAVSVEQLQQMLSEHALKRALATDLDWLRRGLLKQYASGPRSAAFDYACRIAERYGETTLAKKPQAIVGTAHSVKGGEADYVVVFPDLSAAADKHLFEGTGGQDAITRTMYVAFTRAREGLLLCGPATKRHVDLRSIRTTAA